MAALITGLTDEWQADKSITFTVQTGIIVSNPSDSYLFFSYTTGGLPPEPVRQTRVLAPKTTSDGFVMEAGEVLHFGGAGAAAYVMGI